MADESRPGQGLFLTVLEANLAAQAAYDRLGGRPDGLFKKISGDGAEHSIIRYVWSPPFRLTKPAMKDGSR
jgi:RimJ/RimL family protein N-acetyltransferase